VRSALIIVDVQHDFIPRGEYNPEQGALAVPDGDGVVDVILNIADRFGSIIFTKDSHPINHCSFKTYGGLWPLHCVKGTYGCELVEAISNLSGMVSRSSTIRKGTEQNTDSYSGFWDNERKRKTIMDAQLRDWSIDTVFICGLATDYCVKATALDAVEIGYSTYVITDACRAVDQDHVIEVLEEMQKKGVKMVISNDLDQLF
jgi:nicotinamidase/pyrazinamidase